MRVLRWVDTGMRIHIWSLHGRLHLSPRIITHIITIIQIIISNNTRSNNNVIVIIVIIILLPNLP